MPSVDINYLAVIAAAVVNMVVGSFWYSTSLFGKKWAKLTDRKLDDMKGATSGYVVAVAGALIQAWVLVHFVQYAKAATFSDGLQVGFWLWLGFVGVTSAVNSVFAGRSWKLWKIDAGYFLVVLLINSALLAVWS